MWLAKSASAAASLSQQPSQAAYIEVHGNLAFDINDGKGLVYVAPSHNAAGGHDAARAALILLDMESDHAVLCCHLRHLLVIDCAKMLNEDGPPLQRMGLIAC